MFYSYLHYNDNSNVLFLATITSCSLSISNGTYFDTAP